MGLALTACSSGPQISPGFMTWQQTEEEFAATIAEFPYEFPDGTGDVVASDVFQADPGPDEQFQEGYGVSLAYIYWECTWMHEFLTSYSDDPAAADEALSQLEAGLDSVYRRQYVVDPDRVWADQVLKGARLGDVALFREFFTSDCGSLDFGD